jgi:hypothetical protein
MKKRGLLVVDMLIIGDYQGWGVLFEGGYSIHLDGSR